MEELFLIFKQRKGKEMTSPNATCAFCTEGICVKGDGSHPTKKMPAEETALVFCNSVCFAKWEKEHCSWCGLTPFSSALEVSITGQNQPDQLFCSVEHLRLFQLKK